MEKKKLNGKMLLLQIDVFPTFKSQDESNLILYLPFCQSSKLMGKCKNEGLGGEKKTHANGTAMHHSQSQHVLILLYFPG